MNSQTSLLNATKINGKLKNWAVNADKKIERAKRELREIPDCWDECKKAPNQFEIQTLNQF